MRVACELLIHYRLLPSYNPKQHRSRSTHSYLAIGKHKVETDKPDSHIIFLHICSTQNPKGDKYKVTQNIEAVFTKFIEEGKFTIRLKEPAIDINAKCDVNLAKKFLTILKRALINKCCTDLHLSNLVPMKRKQLEKPKTRLIITNWKDYPSAKCFPSNLQELSIHGIQLTRIELRILNLTFLKSLDLSDNCLGCIPPALGKMACLSLLNLKDNKIECLPSCLFEDSLAASLLTLDISRNKITSVPHEIHKLKKLENLSLNQNDITKLPPSIGRMKSLRHFSISDNRLGHIPMSFMNLHLEMLDVFGNPFNSSDGVIRDTISRKVRSLREISATASIQHRVDYSYPRIPASLVAYLDGHLNCRCGKVLFQSHILAYGTIQLNYLASSVSRLCGTVSVEFLFCSMTCVRRWKRMVPYTTEHLGDIYLPYYSKEV